jgi:hypothetical protein
VKITSEKNIRIVTCYTVVDWSKCFDDPKGGGLCRLKVNEVAQNNVRW